jgi:uncharacterized membrane protein
VVTWLAGAMMLGGLIDDALFFKDKALVPIGIGAWLGTIMLFNVWVLIWPNQKKILGIVTASDEEKDQGAPGGVPRIADQRDAVDPDAVLHVLVTRLPPRAICLRVPSAGR